MARFVQLTQPGEGSESTICVNPERVVMIEPLAARGRALCRVWLAAPVGPERAWHRDVVGTYPEILKQLSQGGTARAPDPLGTVGGARRRAS